ncbi:septal ring lytic transglycosylase RlpA family protein [Streptomyces formicae]|uniref:Secreted protein n=1 Tax=Streptomyces formicae TaxID=1616117 RepID=A0ABY3WT94_9ACTN|nr:septal ring lytic transglycosylase RlpA family protein [Streptomyces formicae]UNM14694.1 hypothetical protein J4032_27425 [Streptomyces formicae]
MSRKKTLGGKKKLALLVGAAALVGGTAIAMTGTSQASVACDGLAQAIRNNENFIAGQRANPDAQSAARIANREAVIAQIKVQQEAAGCEAGEGSGEAGGGQAAPPAQGQPPAEEAPPADEQPPAEEAPPAEEQPPADEGAVGEVVCAGSTVTLSGEGGAPAASSNQFPVGTQLKVTNLDNSKSTTVEVTSVSGSCALLNNAAFEQVREPGKFLIRKARIERVG